MPFPLASPFSIRRFNFFCLQVLLTRASLLALAKSIYYFLDIKKVNCRTKFLLFLVTELSLFFSVGPVASHFFFFNICEIVSEPIRKNSWFWLISQVIWTIPWYESSMGSVRQEAVSYVWVGGYVAGAPNVNFRKISARKTIWDLEFSEHFL